MQFETHATPLNNNSFVLPKIVKNRCPAKIILKHSYKSTRSLSPSLLVLPHHEIRNPSLNLNKRPFPHLWDLFVNMRHLSFQISPLTLKLIPSKNIPITLTKNLKPLQIHHPRNTLLSTQWVITKIKICDGSLVLYRCTILLLSQADLCKYLVFNFLLITEFFMKPAI